MILDDLYFRNCEMEEIPPELRRIRNQMQPYDETIKQTLGISFLDEYVQLYDRLLETRERDCYHAGVQFTLRFLLEGILSDQNPHL